MAVQTRRCFTSGRPVGDAIVGGHLVLVAHVGGREVQAPLPDDERTRTFRHDSRDTRKYLLLPSVCCQADTGFDTTGSNWQRRMARRR